MLRLSMILATTLLGLLLAQPVGAVQVQDLARLKGSEQNRLIGMGLVVGLRGTGDGGKYAPAMRSLASVIQHLSDPTVVAAELKDSKNVALVAIEATLPASGVREGDQVDVHVAAIGAAKSLEGGRLFMIPLKGPLPGSPVFAFAAGPIVLENPANPTVGVVRNGAQLTRDVMAQYLDQFGRLTLVLNESVASWPVANNIASLVNGVVAPDGPAVARAIDQKNVVVEVPMYERADPAAFISLILQSYVDPSQIGTGARVVVNERTGTIIISGDVQVSPTLISHKGLIITSIAPPAVNPQGQALPVLSQPQPPQEVEQRFVSIDPESKGGARLDDLMNAFNQLKVDAADRIAILKQLHRSGELHAQFIVE